MKNHARSIWVMVGLLMLPGLGAGTETDASAYVKIATHYEAIRLALLEDSKEDIQEHATAIEKQVAALLGELSPETSGVAADRLAELETALQEIESAVSNLSGAWGVSSAREDFFALTKPLAKMRKLTGDESTVVAYCPMAQKAWIQPPGEIGNPYLGQEMPKCGEVVGE